MIDDFLMNRIETGELLAVDEVKLAAILHNAKTDMFMDNLRGCKWYKES